MHISWLSLSVAFHMAMPTLQHNASVLAALELQSQAASGYRGSPNDTTKRRFSFSFPTHLYQVASQHCS